MIRYPKYFDTSLKYFPILILYTFLNELLGILIFKNESFSLALNNLYSNSNIVIYNIYMICFYLYFFFLFKFHIMNNKYKAFIKYASILFVMICVINLFLQNWFHNYLYLIFFSGSTTLLIIVLLYISENINQPIRNFSNNILFWVATGLLLYHIGYLPIKTIRYYHELAGIIEKPYLRRVHLSLILLMYSCFIIGFIKMKRRPIK